MNLFQFLSNLTILTTGFLLKDLSARNFVIIGSMLVFIGLLLTSFVTTSFQLLFTFPVLIGVGIGMLNPAAFVSVISCFTRKRILAISVGFAALKLGQSIVMPAIVKSSITNFGYSSTIHLITGLSSIGILGGLFLAPVKWRPSRIRRLTERDIAETRPLITKTISSSQAFVREVIAGADLDLLCNLKYVVLLFGLAVTYASSVNLDLILPLYLQVSLLHTYYIDLLSMVARCCYADLITRFSLIVRAMIHVETLYIYTSKSSYVYSYCRPTSLIPYK